MFQNSPFRQSFRIKQNTTFNSNIFFYSNGSFNCSYFMLCLSYHTINLGALECQIVKFIAILINLIKMKNYRACQRIVFCIIIFNRYKFVAHLINFSWWCTCRTMLTDFIDRLCLQKLTLKKRHYFEKAIKRKRYNRFDCNRISLYSIKSLEIINDFLCL
jgi:hypothetical protein